MRRKEAVYIGAQAAIVVGVLALVALPVQSTNGPPASTSSASGGALPVFTSEVAQDGLQLKMVLNATRMQSDGAITGQVTVVNTSGQNVTVSTLDRSQNITEWSNYNNICPSDGFVGYAVFGGHLTAANVSSAGTPLRLAPPMVTSCGGGYLPGPGTITFLSSRGQTKGGVVDPDEPDYLVLDQLNATTLFCNTTEKSQNSFACDWASPGLVGYWNWSTPDGGNYGFTSPAFARFSSGEYTVVAWDDWNQYAYATFVVRSPIVSSTTSTTTVDPTDGFPRNAAGGWDVHYVGADPNPVGCNYSLGSTFGEGYSLSIYSEYDAVKAGGLACISIVLVNVNGTVVTWGNSSEAETGFNVTDSSGKLVFQDSCIPDDEPTIYSGAMDARSTFGCEDMWDTGVAAATGVVPTPGTYTITAFAAFPGMGSEPPVVAAVRESVSFTILRSPVG
jgi:hypothetical protein